MSYEELQEFSNERQSYNAFADDEVINEWGLQRDIEISKIQNDDDKHGDDDDDDDDDDYNA